MKKVKNQKKGVITVFIALMLTGILSLGTLAMEAARLQAAKTQLGEANKSAGTSMIALYNKDLHDRYGLLALDNNEISSAKYLSYLEFNSDMNAGYKGNNISTFYLVDSVEMEGYYNMTYPSVLKRQILSRAKFNIIPQDYSFNYYNMDYFLSDYQGKALYVSDALSNVAERNPSVSYDDNLSYELKLALENLYHTFSSIKKYDDEYNVVLSDNSSLLLPGNTGTIEHNLPPEDVNAINNTLNDAHSVLGPEASVLGSSGGASYSEDDVNIDVGFVTDGLDLFDDLSLLNLHSTQIVSECRAMIQGINASINMLSGDKEGNLLLNSYISGYFPNRNYTVEKYKGPSKGEIHPASADNMTFSGACVEYVFNADKSEINNQEFAYDYIIATRLVSNLYSVISSSSSFDRYNACSVAAHVIWAYYESFVDAELLFRYNSVVPMGKYNSILDINNPANVYNAFSTHDFVEGINRLGIVSDGVAIVKGTDATNYRDALAFALWFVPNSKKMMRIADLIQLEMRYKEEHVDRTGASFLMSEQDTFCRVKCTAKLNSILPVISFGTGEIKGTGFQSIKYVGY